MRARLCIRVILHTAKVLWSEGLPWERLDMAEVLGYTWILQVAGQVEGQVTDGTKRLV